MITYWQHILSFYVLFVYSLPALFVGLCLGFLFGFYLDDLSYFYINMYLVLCIRVYVKQTKV